MDGLFMMPQLNPQALEKLRKDVAGLQKNTKLQTRAQKRRAKQAKQNRIGKLPKNKTKKQKKQADEEKQIEEFTGDIDRFCISGPSIAPGFSAFNPFQGRFVKKLAKPNTKPQANQPEDALKPVWNQLMAVKTALVNIIMPIPGPDSLPLITNGPMTDDCLARAFVNTSTRHNYSLYNSERFEMARQALDTKNPTIAGVSGLDRTRGAVVIMLCTILSDIEKAGGLDSEKEKELNTSITFLMGVLAGMAPPPNAELATGTGGQTGSQAGGDADATM